MTQADRDALRAFNRSEEAVAIAADIAAAWDTMIYDNRLLQSQNDHLREIVASLTSRVEVLETLILRLTI